jgi:TolB protein
MTSDTVRYLLAAAATICASWMPTPSPATTAAPDRQVAVTPTLRIVGEATRFLPGLASTPSSEIRLTLSPDGRTALWFSRNRPGGPGGYDIWMSRFGDGGWSPAAPVPFDTPAQEFDPAFSSDGRDVYFSSNRAGGLGGDDLYRVAAIEDGFGDVEHLGAAVNSAGNEYAPMLSPDRGTLLFSSDRAGGAGGHDLYVAHARPDGFAPAQPLPGAINTDANEFDATFLSDGATIVFSRAKDFAKDRANAFWATARDGRYDVGTRLPATVNSDEHDTYGAMLDWSRPGRFSVSTRRAGADGLDLYLVDYALAPD